YPDEILEKVIKYKPSINNIIKKNEDELESIIEIDKLLVSGNKSLLYKFYKVLSIEFVNQKYFEKRLPNFTKLKEHKYITYNLLQNYISLELIASKIRIFRENDIKFYMNYDDNTIIEIK